MDIHNYEKRLEGILRVIRENPNLNSKNRRKLIDFYSNLSAKGISLARIEHYMYHMEIFSRLISKDFEKVTAKDIERSIIEAKKGKKKNWSERTLIDFKLTLKVFFKWLRKTEDYPPEVEWLKTGKGNKRKLPSEILTQEEVKALIEKTDNPRDRAFVLVLYESGCRIGELLPLKIKDVQPHEHGIVLNVSGKTGDRRILLISSAPALGNWLDSHPFKDNPEAFVWIGIGKKSKYHRLRYGAAVALLKRLADLAGIRKKVNPYAFRHARATHLANYLTEAQLKEFFGWTQGSDVASVYVSLSGRDIDDALLKLHGISSNEQKKEEKFRVQVCSRCGEKNDPWRRFCWKCGSPLSYSYVFDEEKRKRKDEILAKIFESDEEILNRIVRKIKEMGLEKEFFEVTE